MERKFALGDRVGKHSGSWWEGRVVGFYDTDQTSPGYCVQLDMVPNGPVQIYPERALEKRPPTPSTHVEASIKTCERQALERIAYDSGVGPSVVSVDSSRIYACHLVPSQPSSDTGPQDADDNDGASSIHETSPALLNHEEPMAWLVKRYASNGSWLRDDLYLKKPEIGSTARSDFVPLFAAPTPQPDVSSDRLLRCPLCGDAMEDRGYGAVHLSGNGCALGDLAIDEEMWNRRARTPSSPAVILYFHYIRRNERVHNQNKPCSVEITTSDIKKHRTSTPFSQTVLSSTSGADCRPAHCTSPSTVSRDALDDCANGDERCSNRHHARRDLLPEREGEALLNREDMTVPIEHSLAIDPKIAQFIYTNHPNAIRPVLWICHIQRHIVQRSLSFIFAISHRLIPSVIRTRIIRAIQFSKAPTPQAREGGQ